MLPDGQEVHRLETLHPRVYQSVFGRFQLERVVYGTREGQKIPYVPVDTQLQPTFKGEWYASTNFAAWWVPGTMHGQSPPHHRP